MTAPVAPPKASGATWIFGLVMVALVVVVVVLSQDDEQNRRPLDPFSTGRDGLAGVRLLIEEIGGDVSTDVATPDTQQVAILASDVYDDIWAEFEGREDQTAQRYEPVLDWVSNGGILITGVDVPGGPTTSLTGVEDDTNVDDISVPRVIERGRCGDGVADGVDTVEVRTPQRAMFNTTDQTCFGDASAAFVVVRQLGRGEIVRIGTISALTNQSLDEQDNAALAARLMHLGPGSSVAFLSGPEGSSAGLGPLTGPSSSGEGDTPSEQRSPINDEGNPVGAVDDTLVDLIAPRVWAMLVGLIAAVVLYALARGRRLGKPVTEPLPIELPSSSFVDAVGRLYGRVGGSRERTSERLRQDFVNTMAPKVGLASDCSRSELVVRLDPHGERHLERLLLGEVPADDDGVQGLAFGLNECRLAYEELAVSAVRKADRYDLQPTTTSDQTGIPNP